MNQRIEAFLASLRESSPYPTRVTNQLLAEARDHLYSAYDRQLKGGLDPEVASQEALSGFGSQSHYFDRFRDEGGPTYQETNMTRFLLSSMGAVVGALMTSFGLIDTSTGLALNGGNQWTPVVTGAGAITGAVLFGTSIVRRHLAVPVGAGIGLLLAILLRDSIQLGLFSTSYPVPVAEFSPYRPPSDAFIIALIFGLILLGALLGGLLQITFQRWKRPPTSEPLRR